MKGPREGIRRLFHLRGSRPEVEEGVEWEIEHHILERADELEAAGLTRGDALEQARRHFGDVEAVRRALRGVDRAEERRRGLRTAGETLWQDLRYGLRGMRRNAGFAATLVLSLGLAIGVAVAVFAVVDALLLRPLPWADSHELAQVEVTVPGRGGSTRYLPQDVVREWARRDEAFAGLLPHRRGSALYTGGAEPANIVAHRVAPTFEEVLGVPPALGRGIRPEDARPGAEPVALVSDGFWRSALGARPDVLGQRLLLDDVGYAVVGVMPAGFKFPEYATTELWVPLREDESVPGGRVELIGRVPAGELEATRARATALASGVYASRGVDSVTVELVPMESSRGGGELARAVWLLFGAVGLILLVAVVNGSNLLLVRGAARAREISVRLAVGASRRRIIRQLLTETMMQALLSAAVALLVAFAALRAMQGILPDTLLFRLPHALEIERRALAFAFGTALLTGLALGLLPALRSTRIGRAVARDRLTLHAGHAAPRSRLRRGLVIGEVALSVVLLAGAGLLLNSFLRLTAIDPGVRTENVAFLTLPLSTKAQPDSALRASFLPRLEERVRALPGVVAATATGALPANALMFGTALQAEGRPPAGGDPPVLPAADVSPGFVEVVGARRVAGRPFVGGERWDEVAIVDEDLARHLWPEGDPVGKRFRTREAAPWLTVVGVVGDIQLHRRDDRDGDFELLRPFDPTTAGGYVTLAFRTAGDPAALFPAARAAVRELAPNQPVEEVTRAEAAYAESLQIPRFLAVLVTGLAAFALVLAALGLFGVLAYEVAQRSREMGIRMALGAERRELRTMVVREGLVLAAIGAVAGVAVTLALSGFVRDLLFELEPTDPATLGAVVVTMLVAAAAASYLPARRAVRVHPAEVLRGE